VGSPVLVLVRDSSAGCVTASLHAPTTLTAGLLLSSLQLPLDVGAFRVSPSTPQPLLPRPARPPQDSFQVLGLSLDLNYTLLALTGQGLTLTIPATGSSASSRPWRRLLTSAPSPPPPAVGPQQRPRSSVAVASATLTAGSVAGAGVNANANASAPRRSAAPRWPRATSRCSPRLAPRPRAPCASPSL